ncbi:hypothetical protein QYF36_004800 [Acer negundo]|nr:hypothetical protein QYF36_004800 [Acer negundo]
MNLEKEGVDDETSGQGLGKKMKFERRRRWQEKQKLPSQFEQTKAMTILCSGRVPNGVREENISVDEERTQEEYKDEE